ncbi:V-type proton ATPase subunit F [Astathelohania contejeani]|uniref:V-type proton ATPase subunit F n=1 Tax=Astathelohania contejeani TaxID=164912 RepID=A0ABQ7I2W5_9MICR|nr:V-type proton ATPase subunit F [Thelohania contejeani]
MERLLVGIMGDEETIMGFLFTGLENSVDNPNMIIVNADTSDEDLNCAFDTLVSRPDISIIFICDFVAARLRKKIKYYQGVVPSILEIPSRTRMLDIEKEKLANK